MKIGIVTQSYYPVRSGVTEHVYHLGRELSSRGHQVTIITGSSREPLDRGLRVLRIGAQIPLSGYGANVHVTVGWKLAKKLRKIEEEEQFDIVHIQSPTDFGLPLVASRAMRSPKVGTHHSFRDSHVLADVLFKLMRSSFDEAVHNVRAHIAVSPSAASICHRYYPNIEVSVIPNGVDTDRFSPSIEPMPVRIGNEFLILFVGRMDPRKGAKYLFAALPMLEESISEYRVLVVGSGWMKKYYDTYVPIKLRHRVTFAGYATPEELPRYYRAADVYCSPATGNESFGIVLLEAMASGVPIVASDIDGYRNVLTDGAEGLFSVPRDPRSIADRISTLARDPGARARMAEHGRRTALRYDWRIITDQVVEVYKRVLKT